MIIFVLLISLLPEAAAYSKSFQSFLDKTKSNKACMIKCIDKENYIENEIYIKKINGINQSRIDLLNSELTVWMERCSNDCK
jgi:hypothetical protein